MPQRANPLTYLKLVGAMFMWGGTWIAGRVVAQELPAPLAAASIRFFLAATLYASLVGGLLLGAVSLVQGGIELADWSWRVWASVVFLAIGGTALGFTWYADGVKRLGAARAAVFINLVPVFAILQAAWLLNERLGLAVLAGGALVIAGVWLTNQKRENTA